MESNDSPEIPDRGETSDIPGFPSGRGEVRERGVRGRGGVRERGPSGSPVALKAGCCHLAPLWLWKLDVAICLHCDSGVWLHCGCETGCCHLAPWETGTWMLPSGSTVALQACVVISLHYGSRGWVLPSGSNMNLQAGPDYPGTRSAGWLEA